MTVGASTVLAMAKTFRPYSMDQHLLLPPDLRAWLPEGDLALFISDVVDAFDLSAIYDAYETGEGRGQPPYHPAMMVKLLLYAYCSGMPSSRKIEGATLQQTRTDSNLALDSKETASRAPSRRSQRARRNGVLRANAFLNSALTCGHASALQRVCSITRSTRLMRSQGCQRR